MAANTSVLNSSESCSLSPSPSPCSLGSFGSSSSPDAGESLRRDHTTPNTVNQPVRLSIVPGNMSKDGEETWRSPPQDITTRSESTASPRSSSFSSFAATPSTPATPGSGCSGDLVMGAPGHTPYPSSGSSKSGRFVRPSVSFDDSFSCPVPFNTPVDGGIGGDEAIRAREQMEEVVRKAEQNGCEHDKEIQRILSQMTPERKGLARPRKRLNLESTVPAAYDPLLFARLEALEQAQGLDNVTSSREHEALNMIRSVVPGLSDSEEEVSKSSVLDACVRYLRFLKDHVGNEYDEEFLLKEMTF